MNKRLAYIMKQIKSKLHAFKKIWKSATRLHKLHHNTYNEPNMFLTIECPAKDNRQNHVEFSSEIA